MNPIRSASVVAAAAITCFASGASAALLQMNFGFTASGTLNGVAFTNAAVTFTLTGDTVNRQSWTNPPLISGYYISDTGVPSERSFSVAGLGQGTVNSAMNTASYSLLGQNYRALGFGPSVSSLSATIANINTGANAWNMTGVNGPVSGNTSYNSAGAGIPALTTTLGTLQFTSFTGTGTFSATAVPAPGAIALVGVAGLAGSRRRRA